VTEPIGFANPRRTASTPAMSVVATAPMPGSSMASRPFAGAMFVFFISIPSFSPGRAVRA